MTRMLASVTGPEEAAVALASGADIIDLKNPASGVLGAVDPAAVRQTVAMVAGRRPVSAVTGDLPIDAPHVVATAEAMAAAGAAYVKIGFFPGSNTAATIAALAPLAGRARLIAVLFADRAPDLSLLESLHAAGFAGVMLDTAGKQSGRLLDHADLPVLRGFVATCRRLGLMAGLAGGLEAPDVPRLLVLDPDFLGFRGALCGAGGRTTPIDADAVQTIRALIPLEIEDSSNAGVDYRLLAARGYAHDPNGDPELHDRVFVHKLVLPVRIGAYAKEHAAPQRVRFDVDAVVARAARPTQDMRDVFSYDIISDGIRMLIDTGHVALAETLAERIAALVLMHPRVVKVTVRVEKLDVGAGTVGVAIERTRNAATAAIDDLFPRRAP